MNQRRCRSAPYGVSKSRLDGNMLLPCYRMAPKAWGSNDNAQLGNESWTDSSTPVNVSCLTVRVSVTDFSAGPITAGVKADGTAASLGRMTAPRSHGTQDWGWIGSVSTITGVRRSTALFAQRRAFERRFRWSWGFNDYDQLAVCRFVFYCSYP